MAKFDVAKTVTANIIQMIEDGISGDTWQAPWNNVADFPVNAKSKKAYRGTNVLQLWGAKYRRGYTSNYWATFAQWKELGYTLKDAKGHAAMILAYQPYEKTVTDQNGKDTVEQRVYMKYFNVFNADLVEGWVEPETVTAERLSGRMAGIDAIIDGTGAEIAYGGNKAFYMPSMDRVQLPEFENFTSVEGFYSTMFHELGHWTGSKSRLDRDLSGRFGSESYAFEELVAELTAAFTCSALGIVTETRQDHAKYVASWLKILENDTRAIMTAASMASKAMEYIIAGETAEQSKAA